MSLSLLIPFLADGEAPAAAAQTTAAPPPVGGMGSLGSFLPFLLIIAIFYFLMIRPQQRKEKERRKQIEEIRSGTRVLLTCGLIGTVVEALPTTFRIEIAPGTVCEFARGAVSRILADNEKVGAEDNR